MEFDDEFPEAVLKLLRCQQPLWKRVSDGGERISRGPLSETSGRREVAAALRSLLDCWRETGDSSCGRKVNKTA